MNGPTLGNRAPDWQEFVDIVLGRRAPRRAHVIEVSIDNEVMRVIYERCLGRTWQVLPALEFDKTPPAVYVRQLIEVYAYLGYDCAPVWACYRNHPSPAYRITADTAHHNRGERRWVEEGQGLIRTRDDLERFPWEAITPDIQPHLEAAHLLPDGMKQLALTSLFEHVFERLLGLEALAYLLHDDPALVAAVFDAWGQKVYDYYAAVIGMESVGAIFHADDMGFKTSTLISPAALRRHVLPWLKRYAALAHDAGKPFFIHSCGNLYRAGIIDDLIDDVRIDGFHSFQDVIMPVAAFKATYGRRVAALGGVDVDKLVRLGGPELRDYVRDILGACMTGGRFALGTGNTVANYIPVENYLIMIEESQSWQPK